MKGSKRETLDFFLCISPWIVGTILFQAGPIAVALLLSFTQWDIMTPPQFTGLKNYARLIGDPLFRQALKVTGIYVLGVPLRLAGAIAIAVLMNQKIKGITVFRTLYYTPAVVTGVAWALLWTWLFHVDYGLINAALEGIGMKGVPWLVSKTWVLPAFIIMSLWLVGRDMVLFLAALQGIPTQLYESATLDGAGSVRRFFSITVPLITPVIFFRLIMGIILSWQVFGEAYVMTNGRPANASLFYVLYLYRTGFQYFEMGYGSALAWVLFMIILVFTLITFRSSRFWVYYAGGRS